MDDCECERAEKGARGVRRGVRRRRWTVFVRALSFPPFSLDQLSAEEGEEKKKSFPFFFRARALLDH